MVSALIQELESTAAILTGKKNVVDIENKSLCVSHCMSDVGGSHINTFTLFDTMFFFHQFAVFPSCGC